MQEYTKMLFLVVLHSNGGREGRERSSSKQNTAVKAQGSLEVMSKVEQHRGSGARGSEIENRVVSLSKHIKEGGGHMGTGERCLQDTGNSQCERYWRVGMSGL